MSQCSLLTGFFEGRREIILHIIRAFYVVQVLAGLWWAWQVVVQPGLPLLNTRPKLRISLMLLPRMVLREWLRLWRFRQGGQTENILLEADGGFLQLIFNQWFPTFLLTKYFLLKKPQQNYYTSRILFFGYIMQDTFQVENYHSSDSVEQFVM